MDEFTHALRSLLQRSRAAGNHAPAVAPSAVVSAIELAARLAALEREMAEVRSRINGLLYLVAGAVLTQLLLKWSGMA